MPIQLMRGPTSAMALAQRRVDECCAAVAELASEERLALLTDAVRHRNDVREMRNAARLVADMMSGDAGLNAAVRAATGAGGESDEERGAMDEGERWDGLS